VDDLIACRFAFFDEEAGEAVGNPILRLSSLWFIELLKDLFAAD